MKKSDPSPKRESGVPETSTSPKDCLPRGGGAELKLTPEGGGVVKYSTNVLIPADDREGDGQAAIHLQTGGARGRT
eukprot:1225104-Prorocentrum_lima.AAC.1